MTVWKFPLSTYIYFYEKSNEYDMYVTDPVGSKRYDSVNADLDVFISTGKKIWDNKVNKTEIKAQCFV